MCLALMDDRSRPASELARLANVSAQTASNHLAKLTAAGLVMVERQGRWRYYRLTDEEVACTIEALAVISPPRQMSRVDGQGPQSAALFAARTCYRHLAGKLGVAIADALLRERWLAKEDRDYLITPEGIAVFEELGIDVAMLRRRCRIVARRCIEWSERRPHFAGPLGAALADLALTRDWVRRQRGTRAVLVTPFGRSELRRILRVRL
jgi:DNA-binding transcriptional ArsR family regulator